MILFIIHLFVLGNFWVGSFANSEKIQLPTIEKTDFEIRDSALTVLKTKCNVCHKRQNPFMVFNEKNMEKRAAKIYKMVFVKQKMPKGDEIRLTPDDYASLKKWLKTQNIN